jgi:hypothetical protein
VTDTKGEANIIKKENSSVIVNENLNPNYPISKDLIYSPCLKAGDSKVKKG